MFSSSSCKCLSLSHLVTYRYHTYTILTYMHAYLLCIYQVDINYKVVLNCPSGEWDCMSSHLKVLLFVTRSSSSLLSSLLLSLPLCFPLSLLLTHFTCRPNSLRHQVIIFAPFLFVYFLLSLSPCSFSPSLPVSLPPSLLPSVSTSLPTNILT